MNAYSDDMHHRGKTSNLAGDAAERAVARLYERMGMRVAERRWRGEGGEIDLIVRQGATVIFVEVKKSRDFARAAQRIQARQVARIMTTASEFLKWEPAGQMTETRFDVALVNRAGEVELIENAFQDF
jgi:putative endonuclease